MDLFIFPQGATLSDGYGIGVEYAYRRLLPQKDDIVVWYSSYNKNEMLYVRDNDYIIPKIPFFSFTSVYNILRGRVRSELSVSKLSFLKNYSFNHIHCDEVIFYRALKKMFPGTPMDVRFHNCFSRIYFRNILIQGHLDKSFEITLKCELNIEKLIFQDRSVRKIFISQEDSDFYTSMYGVYSDSEIWPYNLDIDVALSNRKTIEPCNKLVWFGGVDSHKKASLNWFISDVLPKVQKVIPEVEFHLYGGGTLAYDNPNNKIFGHGKYTGDDIIPSKSGLYINPDIIGGGVKLKVQTLFDAGVPFISTFYGYEGYDKKLIDNQYCIIEEKEKWAERIISFLKERI